MLAFSPLTRKESYNNLEGHCTHRSAHTVVSGISALGTKARRNIDVELSPFSEEDVYVHTSLSIAMDE